MDSGIRFEWDENKNNANIAKHGISFQFASKVFEDPNCKYIYDEWHSMTEDRYAVIGQVDDILYVVYTEREDSYRLISARQANLQERRFYYYE